MPRPPLLLSAFLLFAGALLLGSSGCGGGSSGTGASGKTLTIATADNVKTVDPALAFDTWSTAVVHAITRRLVDYDAEARILGDLAESWRISDGGRSYTFQIRPDAKFSDGSPVEARHFKAALDHVRNPETASPGAPFYAGIREIEAPDARTLTVRLSEPDPALLNLMGMTFAAPIQPGYDPNRPAASGPYAIESFEPDARVILRRNPHDARNPSSLEQIVLQLGVQEPLQMTRFRSGEVDLLPAVPAAEYARVMGDPSERARVAQAVVNQTWYFGMNVTRKPWSDPRVRRAALLALDREKHVTLAGAGQLANGVLPPHVPGHDPNRKLPARNVAAARKLLAEAGYPNGIPEEGKPVLWLVSNDRHPRHAEAIQSDLAAVGIPVELRAASLSEYLTGYRSRADCWFGGWYPDFPDAGNFLEPVLHGKSIRPGASPNAARYDNPRVNALLDQARKTARGPAREALYRQAEDLILQDLPWIPLYFEAETRYFRPGVTGVTVHPVWRQMLTGIDKE